MGLNRNEEYHTWLIYGLADAAEIAAKRLTDLQTRDCLLKNNLKEPLEIAGEWRWKETGK